MTISSQSVDGSTHGSHGGHGSTEEEVVDWTDLGQRMWSFLTGREAAIHYSFEEMAVEVPRDTGSDAPRATWKLNGTLTVTTSDRGATVSSSQG